LLTTYTALQGLQREAENVLEFALSEVRREPVPDTSDMISDLLFGIGLVQWYAGRYGEAATSFAASRAYAGHPSRGLAAVSNEALALRQTGASAREIQDRFADFIEQPRKRPSERFSRGLLLYAAGRLISARNEFQAVLGRKVRKAVDVRSEEDIIPPDVGKQDIESLKRRAHLALITVLIDQHRAKEARSEWDKYEAETSPEDRDNQAVSNATKNTGKNAQAPDI